MLNNHLSHEEAVSLIGSAIKNPETFDQFDGETIVQLMNDIDPNEIDLNFEDYTEYENALKHFYS